jgi:hypothetical protein
MPNQPIRLMPMASPTIALPPWPNPVHLASSEVCMPSRRPMMPMPMATSSRMIAPNVSASTADQKSIPKPIVAPSRNWESAEIWPKRCTATDHQE